MYAEIELEAQYWYAPLKLVSTFEYSYHCQILLF
jgi:hypothetical protein